MDSFHASKCVRLRRLLAFECTLNHCTFIHSFIHTVHIRPPDKGREVLHFTADLRCYLDFNFPVGRSVPRQKYIGDWLEKRLIHFTTPS